MKNWEIGSVTPIPDLQVNCNDQNRMIDYKYSSPSCGCQGDSPCYLKASVASRLTPAINSLAPGESDVCFENFFLKIYLYDL